MVKIAVIFTCFNRIRKTEECIKGLLSQKCKYDIKLDFYICDDASTDGTADMIRQLVPDCHLIAGSGNLFWSKGMNMAMSEAIKKHHDFYLMVNDDMVFYNNALESALNAYDAHDCLCGIVGCTKSMDETTVTYGGRKYKKYKNIGRADIVLPTDEDGACDIANWNFFLLPSGIIDDVGIIDGKYEHALGDYDYCMRMRKARYPIYVARDFVGKTDLNSAKNTSKDTSLGKMTRIKKFFSVKENPPKSGLRFFVKNYGPPGVMYYLFLTLKGIVKIMLH